MNKDNHIGLFALAFIILAVAMCIMVLSLGGCNIDGNDDVDWVSLSEAAHEYRQLLADQRGVSIDTIITIETTCCWYGVDYYGEYKYAKKIFQTSSSGSTISKYFYCYTSGIYADDGWFY